MALCQQQFLSTLSDKIWLPLILSSVSEKCIMVYPPMHCSFMWLAPDIRITGLNLVIRFARWVAWDDGESRSTDMPTSRQRCGSVKGYGVWHEALTKYIRIVLFSLRDVGSWTCTSTAEMFCNVQVPRLIFFTHDQYFPIKPHLYGIWMRLSREEIKYATGHLTRRKLVSASLKTHSFRW